MDFSQLINISNNTNCKHSIPLKITMESDRAQVSFIPRFTGMYQIYLTSNGDLLNGAPFSIRVTRNETGVKDTFDTENKNENDKSNVRKKKILARIIDFIDEKLIVKNFIKYGHSGNKSSIPELSEVNEIALENIEKEIEASGKNSVQSKVKMFEESKEIRPEMNNKSKTVTKTQTDGILLSERVNNYIKNIPKSENSEVPQIRTKHVKFANCKNDDDTASPVRSKHTVPEVEKSFPNVSSPSVEAESKREKNTDQQMCVLKSNHNLQILNSLNVLKNLSNCGDGIESLAVSDNLKSIFRKRREYWRNICSNDSSQKSTTSLQRMHNLLASSCESFLRMERAILDTKLHDDDSFLTVRERKMLLLHLLEEEQKLARGTNLWNLHKPSSPSSKNPSKFFVDEELKSRFVSARNYFVYLEEHALVGANRETGSLDRKLRKKSRDDGRCVTVTCISGKILNDDYSRGETGVKDILLMGSGGSDDCDEEFMELTFLKKNFKRTRKSVKSLFNIDVSG